MPYANRQKQLEYMRNCMKGKRLRHRLERLKQEKQKMIKEYAENPMLQLWVPKEQVAMRLNQEIERVEGLLKILPKVQNSRGLVNQRAL